MSDAGEKATHYVTGRVGDSEVRRLKALQVQLERSRSFVMRRALQLGLDLLESRAARVDPAKGERV
jgi:predicted transcriptional regulator